MSSNFTNKIENTTEYLLYRNSIKVQLIYIIIVLSVIAALASLPFVYVDVSVNGNGIVRPVEERTQITSPLTAIVQNIYVTEGDTVSKGDVLLKLRDENIGNKIQYLKMLSNKNNEYISDLKTMLEGCSLSDLNTPLYRQIYIEFLQKMKELESRSDKAETEKKRQTILYEKKVIAKKEYEDAVFKADMEFQAWVGYEENARNHWQSELDRYLNEQENYRNEINQLQVQKQKLIIKAPISGMVEQFTGVYTGSHIQAGTNLMVISPDTGLIAEVYVTPKDIGLIQQNSECKIRIHSFNYNDWGLLNGKIQSISNDYILLSQQPVFKVRCVFDKNYLELRNGHRGYLKKGMTLNTRFIVANRSLWQLLFDDISNWMNPELNTTTEE